MAYDKHYRLADDMIAHLDGIMGEVTDPFITSRYVGFVAVSAVTVYELAIKDIFIEFAESKHKLLGHFTESFFERLNGRIKIKDLKEAYITKFGDRYTKRFKMKLELAEKVSLREHGISICSRYGSIITCRHEFAHAGIIPSTQTYKEMIQCYQSGKEVIHCLAETMRR